MKDIILKVTEDEFNLIHSALCSKKLIGEQNVMHYDSSEIDALLSKLYSQSEESAIPRPFIVKGIFDNGVSYQNKQAVVFADDELDAQQVARKRMEKQYDDYFKVKSVHEMTAEDIVVGELPYNEFKGE